VERSDDYEKKRGQEDFFIYSRHGNPSIRNIEEKLARLEKTDDAVFFSSGMAAITSSLLGFLNEGDVLAASRRLYGTTYRFMRDVLPRLGIEVRFLEEEALYDLPRTCPDAKIVYFETPINPTTDCVDIRRVVESARSIGAAVFMDNTFASPINQNPAELGVDVVLHSATKYLGGHSDVVAGVAASTAERCKTIAEMRRFLGGSLNPVDAFLLDRSLKTLEVRVRQHNESAQKLAEFFAAEKKVKRVLYPGLPGSESHEIARRQMRGFGGMLCIELKDLDAAKRFCDSVTVALNATSLGGVETLVTIPVLTSHAGMTPEELQTARVTPGMVRISTGLENTDDLIRDFSAALQKV
jgi:cystathionine beta-lyase/cystathionine gamma-synthase